MRTDKHSWKKNHTLQGAIVLAKLDRFDQEIAQRQAVARRYHELLATDTHGSTRIIETQENIRVHPCKSVANPLSWPQPDRTSVFAQFTQRDLNIALMNELALIFGKHKRVSYVANEALFAAAPT